MAKCGFDRAKRRPGSKAVETHAIATVTALSLSLEGEHVENTGYCADPIAILSTRLGHPRASWGISMPIPSTGNEHQTWAESVQIDTRILKGSALARRLRTEIAAAKLHLESLRGQPPVLVSLLVGEDPAALAYRKSIDRTFKKVDIPHRHLELPATTTPVALVAMIRQLNDDAEVTGVLVLMPLPDHLDPHLILEHLSPLKDVDGITPTNAGRLHLGLPSLRPSTPAGGLELLDYSKVQLEGRRVAVIGRSNVVGRPLATLLTQRNATVTLCHRKTINLGEETRRAEIICIAAGSAGLVTRDMVTPGTVVIDFGVNVTPDGKIVGDADYEGLLGVAGSLTPVPGGTGPVTALVLARNTLAAGFASLRGSLDDVLFELPAELQLAVDLELEQHIADASANHV